MNQIEVQEDSDIPAKVKMKRLNYIIIIPVIFILTACSKNRIPQISGTIDMRGFDTTQYNLLYADALKQKMLGNFGDALKYFEQAIIMNPDSDAAYYQISQIAAVKGDFGQARQYGIKAYRVDPGNNWYISNVAALYYQANMLDSVAWYYNELLNVDPDREDILFNLGSIYAELGQLDEAEKIFEEFKVKYSSNASVIFPLVNVYREQGRIDEAEKLLIKIINIEPENLNYRGLLAEFYRSTGENDKAIKIYRSLFEEDPTNGLLQLSYLDFVLSEKKYNEVCAFINTLLINEKVDFDDKLKVFGRILNDTSLVREKSNELILSALVFKADNKNNPAAILAIVELYDIVGKKQEAIDVLEEYLKNDQGNYFIWERLLFLYNDIQNIDKLYATAKKASSLFNMIPTPKLMLAFAATDRGEYELALKQLNNVRILVNEQEEYMVQILSLEADIYYRQGQWKKAFGKFDEALEYNSSDPLILNNYAYFMAEQNYDLKKSRELIEKCLKIDSNPTYLDTYAWVLYKQGKVRKAEGVMDALIEAGDVNDPELWEHIGYIKRSLRKCDDAIIAWGKALGLDSTKKYLKEEIEKCRK